MDRPYVHINCASTADGKIALPDGRRLRISTEWDKTRVHRLRASLGAVLVGAGTVVSDDPKLSVDPDRARGVFPITKIVMDGAGRINATARFLRTEGRSILVTTQACPSRLLTDLQGLAPGYDVEVMVLPGGPDMDIGQCLGDLYRKGIAGVLVEGGSETIARFLSSGHFDLFTVFYAPMVLGGRGPTIASGDGIPGGPSELSVTSVSQPPGGGLLVEYRPVRKSLE